MFPEALEDPRPIAPLYETLGVPESQVLLDIELRKAATYVDAALTEAGPELGVSLGTWAYAFLRGAILLLLGHQPTYAIKLKLIRMVDEIAQERAASSESQLR